MNLYIKEDFLKLTKKLEIKDIDMFVIGHTATKYLPNYIDDMGINNKKRCEENKIYKDKNKIVIDCGCGGKHGKLGCIRLNDLKEFYINK